MQLSQTSYLVKLLLRLKCYKFIWIIAVLISVFSNQFVFPLVDSWLGNFGRTLAKIDANEFFWNSVIMVDIFRYKVQFVLLMDIIKTAEGNHEVARHFIRECGTTNDCSRELFKSLYGRSNSSKYTTYADYGEVGETPKITCQVAYGADLHCPYFGHLAASSKTDALYRGGHTFGKAQFFSLTAHSDRTLAYKVQQESNSSCATLDNFDLIFSRTVMVQTLLFTSTTFFYFLVSTVSCIVDLKRNGFLKIMFQKGLSVRSYWIAIWSVTSMEILLIACLLTVSYVIQCPGFYKATSVLAVLFGTILQLFSMAALTLLLTVMLQKYFHIGLIMVLITVCTCVTVLIMRLLLHNTDFAKIVVLILFPLGHIGEFTLSHLLSVIIPESVTAYHYLVLAMSFMFSIVVVALTLYLDFILKNGNGCCLQHNYFLDKRFWITNNNLNVKAAEDPLADDILPDMANVEQVTEGMKPIVKISQACKTYASGSGFCSQKRQTVALTNISAHIYEGQITAVIGHNGSGKTTLLNILNGTDTPTSGRVSVDGLLVNDPINRIKLHRIIGICPQDNSLSSSLTVMETLEMAQISCHRNPQDWEEESDNLLKALRLTDKKNMTTNKLSGGTMRKLCTAVALIGDCKVLFLDEPTSGVDPMSRRRMWKLLQEYKLKCSIILSTQSMDEADTLADRKIFLSGGSLICAGSSLFLKSAFDCGFDFNVTLKSPNFVPLLIRQIKQEFSTVVVKNNFKTCVDFHLSAAEINQLPALAQALERRGDWVAAFGLLQTSLYDIFMRLRDLQPNDVEKLFKEGDIGIVSNDDGTAALEKDESKKQSEVLSEAAVETETKIVRSVFRSFRAMAYLNMVRVFRSRVKLGSRIVAPTVLLIALVIMALIETGENNSKLHLRNNITNFGDAFTKGVCVYQLNPKEPKLKSDKCAAVFNSAPNEKNYMVLEMPEHGNIYEFLQHPSQMARIKTLCYSPGKSPIECPIVYTSKWNTTSFSDQRSVFVGSFSVFEQFNSSFAASVTNGAYYRLSRYFMAAHVGKDKIPKNDFRIVAESVYNFRSTFVPLYGIFFQLFLISILPATFLDDLIEDKETKVRNQLSSIGMGAINYWITMYFVHWLQYAIIYLISVIFIVTINLNGYANIFYLAGIVLPTLIFGLSSNQLTVYALSSLLNKSNPIVTVAYFFFSIFLVVIMLCVQLDNVAGIAFIALVPPFASIALTFHGTKAIFYTLSFFKVDSTEAVKNNIVSIFFSQPHILCSYVAVIIHGLALPLLLSLLERRVELVQWIENQMRSAEDTAQQENDDYGVKDEMERLAETPRNPENLLESCNLWMTYPNGAKVVQGVTFATSPGEVFGLLGPNGAGKSTTMAVMVGDLTATGGRCEVQCREGWLSSGLAARRGYIGYCPQYNPQYDDITAREHLEFYACILGVPKADATSEIDNLLESLELDQHDKKKSSELSFGFRRRLSLASALLGDPCLLVIDEASTGVDPEGKRILWRSIRELASGNLSIIVTSHSMEEVEALCSRVCVMNQGVLVGLGSVQQLKSRYGQSYTLEVLIATEIGEPSESVDDKRLAIVDSVLKKFANSSVVEEFTNRVTFSIPQSSVGRLSHALSWLTEIKQPSNILYFSFYQMSLDQVFGRMIVLHNRLIFPDQRDSVVSTFSEPEGDAPVTE